MRSTSVAGQPMQLHQIAWIIAVACASFATLVSIWNIYFHLNHYTEPPVQRHLVRIILMIPVYSIDSMLGILIYKQSIYFDLLRDCYEAWVIYQFFRLLLNYLDGEERLIEILEQKPRLAHAFPLCFIHSKPGSIFFHRVKALILQFVFVKVFISIFAFVSELTGIYGEGSFSPKKTYVYILVIQNISITTAMYCLVLFYKSTEDVLAPFRPIPKFLCIKAVIFFAFWQGVIISILVKFGVMEHINDGWKTEELAKGLQNLLICMEMVPLSLAYAYSFGRITHRDPQAYHVLSEFKELENFKYHLENVTTNFWSLCNNFIHAVNPRDALVDAYEVYYRPPKRFLPIGDFLSLRQDEQQSRVLKQAYVMKRSEDITHHMQRRYLLLLHTPRGLIYYKKNPFAECHKAFDPSGFIDIVNIRAAMIDLQQGDHFSVTTPWRSYVFAASSAAEALAWVTAINSLIEKGVNWIPEQIQRPLSERTPLLTHTLVTSGVDMRTLRPDA